MAKKLEMDWDAERPYLAACLQRRESVKSIGRKYKVSHTKMGEVLHNLGLRKLQELPYPQYFDLSESPKTRLTMARKGVDYR